MKTCRHCRQRVSGSHYCSALQRTVPFVDNASDFLLGLSSSGYSGGGSSADSCSSGGFDSGSCDGGGGD